MTGTPAPDVYVSTHTGGLDGLPTMVGTFNFGVIAVDYAGGYGTKDYSLTIQKATPLMTVTALDAAVGEKMRLEAEVRHSSAGAPFQPTGTVSFSIDGAAVTACSGASAPAVQPSLYAICYVDLPSGIAGGTHVVQADYLPDVASSGAYTSASGTANLKVLYTITGLVFEDLDLDGVRDDGEILSPWKIDLDQDCDGTIDQSQDASQFSFDAEAGGKYCLQADESANWRQTTQIQSFTADANKYFEIGITYHELTFDKTSFEGEMGVAFEAVVTASGGTPPYAFTIVPGALPYPEGLT